MRYRRKGKGRGSVRGGEPADILAVIIHRDTVDTDLPGWQRASVRDREEPTAFLRDWGQIHTEQLHFISLMMFTALQPSSFASPMNTGSDTSEKWGWRRRGPSLPGGARVVPWR